MEALAIRRSSLTIAESAHRPSSHRSFYDASPATNELKGPPPPVSFTHLRTRRIMGKVSAQTVRWHRVFRPLWSYRSDKRPSHMAHGFDAGADSSAIPAGDPWI